MLMQRRLEPDHRNIIGLRFHGVGRDHRHPDA
jgi:hypothetical protein